MRTMIIVDGLAIRFESYIDDELHFTVIVTKAELKLNVTVIVQYIS